MTLRPSIRAVTAAGARHLCRFTAGPLANPSKYRALLITRHVEAP